MSVSSVHGEILLCCCVHILLSPFYDSSLTTMGLLLALPRFHCQSKDGRHSMSSRLVRSLLLLETEYIYWMHGQLSVLSLTMKANLPGHSLRDVRDFSVLRFFLRSFIHLGLTASS
ncbi:hypothetical protein BDR04DRAFT_710926 [Suillus decipiens]|nr:hypothetical protein BDR04DRAFT_710926 [Suillus decipiens]